MEQNSADKEFQERVVSINRVTKVVKGGRKFSFSALVVVGDGKGQVGYGYGKATEVPEAIAKAARFAKKSLKRFPLRDTRTLEHEVEGYFSASKIIILPAAAGTGVIAGGALRSVLETLGVRDVLTKCIGSKNPHNVVKACFDGLSQLKTRNKGEAVEKAQN